MNACRKDLIGCQDCGHIFDKPACPHGEELSCQHCGAVLLVNRKDWLTKAVAFTLTGIILFGVTLSVPFLGLEAAGQTQSSHLVSSVEALLERKQFLLATLVFVTVVLFPLAELIGLSYVLGARMLERRAPGFKWVLHMLFLARPWNMMEIFFLGMLVTAVKLGDLAELQPGIGVFTFAGLVVVLILSHMHLSREELWDWIKEENYHTMGNREGATGSPVDEEFVTCRTCRAMVSMALIEDNARCPRCQSPLSTHHAQSYQRSLGLLVAAAVLFIPANTLPIMTTATFGTTTSNTIFSGVVHLIEEGALGIAAVVFVASIMVPIAKFLIMGYLLWAVKHPGTGTPEQQITLYRMIEFVGRWSMIDVFVVALLVSLVQFGSLTSIEPGVAILCFAAVVVLTMMAAETFEPRLIWDAYNEHEKEPHEKNRDDASEVKSRHIMAITSRSQN
ncbi:MAG: paraquat-inducible protein A [Nitrospirales bacterium]|nr:paraquat-inducible protein A [Nitrospira sp.]MDR4502750.1 paraquat-inducible protein A [Nitrospirales bacterium]